MLRHFSSQLVKTNGNRVNRVYLVDTLALVRKLETQGLPTKQAEAITSTITETLNDSLENVVQSFVSKSEMDKIEMIQESNLSKFKSETKSTQEHHFSSLQRETGKLQGDIEKLRSELRYEVDKVTAGHRLDLNLERGRIRDELAKHGNDVPGNVLTGFKEPFWLVDIANIAVLIHLVGAFQVYGQPIYAKYEGWLAKKWPESAFFHHVHTFKLPFLKGPAIRFTKGRLVFRTLFVVLTTLVSLMLPFFNAILGLLGAIAFWPLTVYYPVTVYIAQAKIKQWQPKWVIFQCLSVLAFIVSVLAAIGSVADIANRLKHATIFKIEL